MKKWMTIVFLLFVFIGYEAIDTYKAAMRPYNEWEETVVPLAERKAKLKTVTATSHYMGKSLVHIVEGVDRSGDDVIAFVSGKGKYLGKIDRSSGISRKKAKAIVRRDKGDVDIVSVQLGLENGIRFWEIKYVDSDNRFNYYYLQFENGTFLKRYSINR